VAGVVEASMLEAADEILNADEPRVKIEVDVAFNKRWVINRKFNFAEFLFHALGCIRARRRAAGAGLTSWLPGAGHIGR
jgi:hypothetical protein